MSFLSQNFDVQNVFEFLRLASQDAVENSSSSQNNNNSEENNN